MTNEHSLGRASSSGRSRGDGVLIASAVGLTGLVLALGSGIWSSPALAETTAAAGGFAMLTTDDGTDEALLVVDNRTEQLLVYQVQASGSFELVDREALPDLFRAAKLKAGLPDG